MMGLGVLGNGSSPSSSSNLSPLAPPFTVDRTNPRPNSTQLVHFTEAPFLPFQSSFQSWQYSNSSASKPDLYFNLRSEVDSIRTACHPSADDYGFSGCCPAGSSNVAAATDAFTVVDYSSDKNMGSKCVEAKPYYPSFVSPVVGDALTESNYDLLSASFGAPLDGSSQVDYNHNQSLSGTEYTQQWGSLWNGFLNEQQGSSEVSNIAGSHVYKDYIKQGACLAERLRKQEEVSSGLLRKCNDNLGRESKIVSPSIKLNDEFSSGLDPWYATVSSSETSVSGLGSTLLKSHSESVADFWRHQEPYKPSHDKCFQTLDSHINDRISVKKSSPALVIRPPSTGTSLTLSITGSCEDVKSFSNAATSNEMDFHALNPFNQKNPDLPLTFDGTESCLGTSQPSVCMEKSEHKFVGSFSTRKEDFSSKPIAKDILDPMLGAGTEYKLPNINIPDGLTLVVDSGKGFTSVEDSSKGVDHYNSAVDSPCWKGGPAAYFAPSDVSEARNPQYLTKNLDECHNLKPHQTHICSSCHDETVNISCQNMYEKTLYQEDGYEELGSLLCSERPLDANFQTEQHSSADTVEAGFTYPEPSCINEAERPTKQYDMPNDIINDSDLKRHTKPPIPNKDKMIYERESKSYAAVVDTGSNVNGTLEPGSTLIHSTSTSFLSRSAENDNDLAKLQATESIPEMNVQILVNMIHNLSELLLYHCSNDTCSVLSGDEFEALQKSIKNLDACVSKKNVHIAPAKKSLFPQQDVSPECKEFPGLHKDVIAHWSLRTKGANSDVQLGHHHNIQEVKNLGDFSKRVEKFPDFVSLRDCKDIAKDVNMVQAIKEILKENFCCKEEMQSETSLYKNLWLEAEAALCSVNIRARFNCVKLEMQKCKSHEEKGAVETTMAVEKLPSSNFSSDTNTTHEVAPGASDETIANNSYLNFTVSRLKEASNDVDTRLKILKYRGENSNSVNAEGQQMEGIIDTEFSGISSASGAIERPKAVGMLPSSKVSSDLNMTHKLTSGSSDETNADNSCQDNSVSMFKKASNDVDASVLARLEILKSRGERSNFGVNDTGFSGKRNLGPFIEDSSENVVLKNLNAALKPHSHYGGGNSKAIAFGKKMIGSEHYTRRSAPLRTASDRAILSEWEHVWIDEFGSLNR